MFHHLSSALIDRLQYLDGLLYLMNHYQPYRYLRAEHRKEKEWDRERERWGGGERKRNCTNVKFTHIFILNVTLHSTIRNQSITHKKPGYSKKRKKKVNFANTSSQCAKLSSKRKQHVFTRRKIKTISKCSVIGFSVWPSDIQIENNLSILATIESLLPKDAQMERLDVVHHRLMRHHYKDLVMNDLSRCHQIGHASVY